MQQDTQECRSSTRHLPSWVPCWPGHARRSPQNAPEGRGIHTTPMTRQAHTSPSDDGAPSLEGSAGGGKRPGRARRERTGQGAVQGSERRERGLWDAFRRQTAPLSLQHSPSKQSLICGRGESAVAGHQSTACTGHSSAPHARQDNRGRVRVRRWLQLCAVGRNG